EQTAAAQKALRDTQNSELANMRADLAKRQSLQGQKGTPDNAANIAIDKGVITTILNQQKQDAAKVLNADLDAKNKRLEADKAASAAALAARKAADALAVKAQEAAHLAWAAI